ncbi:hypothetical protein CEUSTIGMA_g4794.t1 [Chlamydomonas eustigma]|uniref:Uncharacterized protein n=1 Tax=Chlamydomonas eustigma TaxID=1157962 RepID=A0A250X2Q1_9CHLO|nr:hypothetical protein CEUSTIGMA_g4794.t1 [Chlamydomonas eustigma]|eukprot:GAX77348.1 hypothetical protein CEUSTIGMA_g4794.t1 [Chlamydomonas eustigma]
MGSGISNCRSQGVVGLSDRIAISEEISSLHLSNEGPGVQKLAVLEFFSGVSAAGFDFLGCRNAPEKSSRCGKHYTESAEPVVAWPSVSVYRQHGVPSTRKLLRSDKPVSLFARVRTSTGETASVLSTFLSGHRPREERQRFSPPLKSLSSDMFPQSSSILQPETKKIENVSVNPNVQDLLQKTASNQHELIRPNLLEKIAATDASAFSSQAGPIVHANCSLLPHHFQSSQDRTEIKLPPSRNSPSPETPVRSSDIGLHSSSPAWRTDYFINSSPFSSPPPPKKSNSSRDLSLHVYSPSMAPQKSSLKKSNSMNGSSSMLKVSSLTHAMSVPDCRELLNDVLEIGDADASGSATHQPSIRHLRRLASRTDVFLTGRVSDFAPVTLPGIAGVIMEEPESADVCAIHPPPSVLSSHLEKLPKLITTASHAAPRKIHWSESEVEISTPVECPRINKKTRCSRTNNRGTRRSWISFDPQELTIGEQGGHGYLLTLKS